MSMVDGGSVGPVRITWLPGPGTFIEDLWKICSFENLSLYVNSSSKLVLALSLYILFWTFIPCLHVSMITHRYIHTGSLKHVPVPTGISMYTCIGLVHKHHIFRSNLRMSVRCKNVCQGWRLWCFIQYLTHRLPFSQQTKVQSAVADLRAECWMGN